MFSIRHFCESNDNQESTDSIHSTEYQGTSDNRLQPCNVESLLHMM